MTLNRLASLVVALGWFVAGMAMALPGQHVAAAAMLTAALAMPLALIWFPDFFGDYVGPVRGGHITRKTPAELVAAAGWFFLVVLPIVVWLILRRG